jgi:hypothetical protein
MLGMPLFRLPVVADGGILHASHAFIKEAAMRLDLKQPILSLETGQVLTLQDAAGRRISARSGTVWVTEEGRPHDLIVEGGDSIVLERDGRTVVQALAPSVVAIR